MTQSAGTYFVKYPDNTVSVSRGDCREFALITAQIIAQHTGGSVIPVTENDSPYAYQGHRS